MSEREYRVFGDRTDEQQAESLGAYLPNDCTFVAKNKSGSKLRNFLIGLGGQLRKFDSTLNTLVTEFGPDCAQYLLPEWERMLGIPDDCFENTDSVNERRTQALAKLSFMNCQTIDDMQRLATLLGYPDVEIISGYDAIRPPYNYVIPEIPNDDIAKFSIVVLFEDTDSGNPVFTLTFPIFFGSAAFGDMICALKKVKPANCQLVLQQTN